MLLRTVYAVRPSAPERRLDLDVPLPLALADGVRAVVSVGDEGELRLVMERRVDPTALEVAADTEDWELAPEGWEEPRRRCSYAETNDRDWTRCSGPTS